MDVEIASMLSEELATAGHTPVPLSDGDQRCLTADQVLLVGDCLEFDQTPICFVSLQPHGRGSFCGSFTRCLRRTFRIRSLHPVYASPRPCTGFKLAVSWVGCW